MEQVDLAWIHRCSVRGVVVVVVVVVSARGGSC
jgi:hypothetical protein